MRNAEPRDAERVALLSGQLGYPATGDDIARRLAAIGSDVAAVLVAEAPSGEIVGWVHVRRLDLLTRDACAEIGGLVVDEARRGHGIGSRLVEAAEQWARHAGLASLRLRSNVARAEAHAFYERLGFTASKTSLLLTKTL